MASMSKPMVRCRCCGHQIRGKEIMRTDLYEREPGRNYVYVKFRCRRCKRMGQTFVPEARWDWSFLEPARDELSDAERDRLLDAGPISDAELLDFHFRLKHAAHLTDLAGAPSAESKFAGPKPPKPIEPRESKGAERDEKDPAPGGKGLDAKTLDGKSRDVKGREPRRDAKGLDAKGLDGKAREARRDGRLNTGGDARQDDVSAGS